MNPGSAVLVGSALPPDIAARHKDVSVAAAKWQLDFASVLARDFEEVKCISFVPLARGENPDIAPESSEPIQIIPVYWRRSPGGLGGYVASIVRSVVAARKNCRAIFCYNPSPWTAPWAMLLSILSGAPMVMIVADVAPNTGTARQKTLARVERILLGSAQRFLLLSDTTRELLPPRSLDQVFAGLPDAEVLRAALPTQSARVRFVYAGSLAPYGGVQVFMEAAAKVGMRADCEFHVFGKGTLASPLSPDIGQLVTVHGFVSDSELNAFLGTDCVGVNPRIDPSGINRYNAPYKLLYYLARGVPTITTVTPGVAPVLADACVVAEEGVAGLAAAMNKVLRMTPAERLAIGEKGRQVVAAQQSADVLREKIQALLS